MDVPSTRRARRWTSRRLETLERRDVPATFGVPWADPGHLTISFAPDGTSIAGEPSNLFETLDAQMPTAAWQGEVLRAFQAWAGKAGINLTVVADDGSPFGAAGQSQHDPRFGDIRIGAYAMAADALAVSVPNDPSMTGTWTGDLLLNSADAFGPGHLDLFDVVLHEAGHVFGLAESADPKSPLYASYAANATLTAGDVKNLQVLYGARPADANEGSSGNDTVSRAATLQVPGSYKGATPLVAFGDIAGATDTDVYALRPPMSNYQGGATIRLQAAGISLLAPHLVVVDARGAVLGEATGGGGTTGSTLTVHLDRVSASSTYYLKVSGATADEFGFGHYGLAVTFDATSTIPTATLDAVLRRDGQGLAPNDIAALFLAPAGLLYNDDRHSDDAPGTATVLSPSPGYFQQNHYQTLASLSDAADVDNYRVKPARSASGSAVLTVRLRAVTPDGVVPRATVLDSDGTPLPTTVLANGGGQFVVQATGFRGGGSLTIRVAGAPGTATRGNYGLDADFGETPAALATFTTGSLSADRATATTPLYVARSQLFQFLLAVDAPAGAGAATPAGAGVRMTIVDAAGRVVLDHFAAAGDVASAPSILLGPGAYAVRYSVIAPAGTAPALGFRLMGEAISDPIGPTVRDPTLTPVYTNPDRPGTYLYPPKIVSPFPFWIATVPT